MFHEYIDHAAGKHPAHGTALHDQADLFCRIWGEGVDWEDRYDGGPHEANFLKLDCSLLKSTFNWKPKWGIHEAISKVVDWSKLWMDEEDVVPEMDKEIAEYFS